MFEWLKTKLRTSNRKRILKKNYRTKRYRYADDGVTKIYLKSERE